VARGARPERVAVVGNTPENAAALMRRQGFPQELERLEGRPRAVFVGVLIADRGVTESVESLRLVAEQVPDAALVVVGDGPDRPRLARTVERLGLSEHVLILGWREHA